MCAEKTLHSVCHIVTLGFDNGVDVSHVVGGTGEAMSRNGRGSEVMVMPHASCSEQMLLSNWSRFCRYVILPSPFTFWTIVTVVEIPDVNFEIVPAKVLQLRKTGT